MRNHIAQTAIEKAEKGDYREVRRVLKLLQNPYSNDINIDGEEEEEETQGKQVVRMVKEERGEED